MKTNAKNKQKCDETSSKGATRPSVAKSSSAFFYCEKGQLQLNDGKLLQALEYFQAALELDNENVEALQGLQSVWQRMGKQQKADEVQKRLDMLLPQPSNNSIQNNNRFNPKKWSLKIPTKVSKDLVLVVSIVLVAYLGVFFSPLITVSMDKRYDSPGYIPFFINHLITIVPSLLWMIREKTSIKIRSFLLGTLIPIPIFSGVLFALYEQQSYSHMLGVDYSSIIWFAVILFIMDLLLTSTLIVLLETELLELKKWFLSNNWIAVLVCLFLSSFILLSLSMLMWQSNAVEILVNLMGNVIAIVGMVVVVIILFIFALAIILFQS